MIVKGGALKWRQVLAHLQKCSIEKQVSKNVFRYTKAAYFSRHMTVSFLQA